MINPRNTLSAILVLVMLISMMSATAQDRRSRQSSATPIDRTVQSRRGPQSVSNTSPAVAAKPMTVEEHEAQMFEKAKKTLAEQHKQWVKRIKEKDTPNFMKHEVRAQTRQFSLDSGREPNADELKAITASAKQKAAEQEQIALKATEEGFKQRLVSTKAYYAGLKKTREDKIAKLKADNERLRLPQNLGGMYAVMSSGAVLEVADRSKQDKHYPYRLYIVQLSDYLREAGRNAGELVGKARYNYQTQNFEYLEALDYSNAFDIPLNYELVKQGCGTIYSDRDVKFKFQAPEGDDLAENNAVKQWRALSTGLVCPYVEPDYANCRIKRCLKQVANVMNLVLIKDAALAIETGKRYRKEVAATRMTYKEHAEEMAEAVASINSKLRQRRKQEQRANGTRDRYNEDALINQFIIDQAWGRAPTEKPVW